MTIRLLIVDDHPVVRDGLQAILGTQPDFEVVGEAATGHEALAKVATLAPDLVLLDLEMPDLDGVATLQALRLAVPGLRAIVFTAFDTDDRILGAIRAGAQGYLLKGTPRDELFAAIRVVHGGGSLLQPLVAAKLIQHVVQPTVEALTPREHEVLGLLAQGLQNKEIARQLGISERTIKFHISSVFAKLGATNRTEAVNLAVQQGILKR